MSGQSILSVRLSVNDIQREFRQKNGSSGPIRRLCNAFPQIAVNASREWLPRPPRVANGAVRGLVSADSAPRLRAGAWGWAYTLTILLLCAEWILRRRRGMR